MILRARPSTALGGCLTGLALCAAGVLALWPGDRPSAPRTGSRADTIALAPPPAPAAPVDQSSPHAGAASDRLRAALAAGDYAGAVEHYSASYNDGGLDEVLAGRELLLEHASRLIQDRELASAVELLGTYLDIFYRDVEAHLQIARAQRDRGDLRLAVESFQAAWNNAHRLGVRELLSSQLHWTLNLYVQQLRADRRVSELVEVYRALTLAQPGNPHYFIALAQAHLAHSEPAAAIEALSYVADDADVGARARAMIGEILTAGERPG